MTVTKTPEEFIDRSGEPLEVVLGCRAGRHTSTERFEWAMIDPEPPKDSAMGDGVALCRIVTCTQCEAVDDHEIDPASAFGTLVRGPRRGPGIAASSTARRPSGTVRH